LTKPAPPFSEATWDGIEATLSILRNTVAHSRKRLEAAEGVSDPQDLAAEYLLSVGQLYLPHNARLSKAVAVAGLLAAKGRSNLTDYLTLKMLSDAFSEHCQALRALSEITYPQDLAAVNLLICGRVHLPGSIRMARAVAAAGLSATKGRNENKDHRALLELAHRVLQGDRLRPASRKAARLASGNSSESTAVRIEAKFRANREFYTEQVGKALTNGISFDDLAEGLQLSLARPLISLGSHGIEVRRCPARRRPGTK